MCLFVMVLLRARGSCYSGAALGSWFVEPRVMVFRYVVLMEHGRNDAESKACIFVLNARKHLRLRSGFVPLCAL